MENLVYIINSPPFWLKTPPLALFYLKNYLQSKNCTAKILDLNITVFKALCFSKKEWLSLNETFEKKLFFILEEKLPEFFDDLYQQIEESDFIGFSIFKRNYHFAFSLAGKIHDKFPDKKIIFGGPQTFVLEREKKLNPDYLWVVGEGEIPLYEIINSGSENIYSFTEIADLDSFPFIDFDPINFNEYSSFIPLLSSRGCLYNCAFCSERKLYHKFRCHSPLYIAEEIKYLSSKYKIFNFIFCDSLINYSNKWLDDFCSLLIKYNLNIHWEAQIRVLKSFPLSLAKLMKQSGCYNLFIGLESASDRALTLMNKGFDAAAGKTFMETLYRANLHFEISLIAGFPGETEKDFDETLNFIRDNKKIIPKVAQINPFIDYLGNFPEVSFPTDESLQRVNKMLLMLKNEKIKYTKSFINNLLY